MIKLKQKSRKTKDERVVEINFGKMIKKLRIKFEYTQNDLADKTDLSTQTISNIENHGQNVGIGTIKLFANAFNMSMSEFFSHFEE